MNDNFENIDLDEVFLSFWASQDGLTREEYLIRKTEREIIQYEASKVMNFSPNKWPKLYFNWDLRQKNQRLSFDNVNSLEDLNHYYPEGFLAFKAELKEVDSYLNSYSKRTLEDLWKVGYPDKLAQIIIYLSNKNNSISPPVIMMNEAGITLKGGNHRYTAAKFSSQKYVTMYTTQNYKSELNKLLKTIEWLSIKL
ncbi:hypothetical protein AMD27_00775 [Acinetobacter sp. TGL-Y2]|uniref:hypothetical protein n=1 Tax=Acinetobacter sp. TGL-Y2 TaxID=1407071 RepID=UPI0007A64AA4|nr:hypothetical protein [Acinetobacter sp. TGL-Y2]AMW77578.1 hypothetical protein AMD27_00775 [Acinetobacter sp. TGL-Y2]